MGESSNTGGKGADTGQGGESWALLNLILAILGLILAALCALAYLAARRRNRAFADLTDEEDVPTRSPAKTLLTILLGILGAVLFIILERIFGRMVMIDEYTIFFAIVFVAEVIIAVLDRRENRYDEEEFEEVG